MSGRYLADVLDAFIIHSTASGPGELHLKKKRKSIYLIVPVSWHHATVVVY